MKQRNALGLVFERNAFYRRTYYLALATLFLSVMVIGLLLWVWVYLSNNPSPPLYFAADRVGRLMTTTPVSQPNMSEQEVEQWAIEAVEAAFSYDYINYRAQLQNAQKYFTTYGWRQYMNGLTASNNLTALKQRKMLVSARVAYKPELMTKGILSGAYAWKYKMLLLADYKPLPYDKQSNFTNPLEVTVIIQRQPELQSYRGLGVLQVVGKFATAAPARTRQIKAMPQSP